MKHQFKANKLQIKVTSERHPDGMMRTFNNICPNPSDEQITGFLEGITLLTGETIQTITLTNAETLANN
ncbi:hypothetical protein [uncultured Limosilactobacillus sp.]|uniref:DUF1659 domain-containing protein n=1 Tax=uncultured Limosilactobacillus sp. TaxID=2837629 RepID=UPI0025EC7FE4|nr:hypothetical protein [uncultured Limosilactobacillus sp.]